MRSILFFISISFLFLLCDQKIDKKYEMERMMQADRDFSQMSVENGAKAAFDFYMTDDVSTYRQNSHPISGRENFLALFSDDPKGTLEWEPFYADISESGDIGYTLGKSEYYITDSTGLRQSQFGYYVTIWKKQEDGSWKFVFDTGVNAPAQALQ